MKYYIAENGQPAGPFDMQDLINHGLNPNSQVWNEKMSGWTRASEVPELMSLLSTQQPAVQHPQSPYAAQQPQPATQQSPYAPHQPEQTQRVQPNNQQPPQRQSYGQQPSPYAQPQYQQPVQQYPQQPYGNQSYGQPYAPQGFPPKNWMTESIIFTVLSVICCCNPIALITGIIAIVNAGKVNGQFRSGNTLGANESAKTAKMWALITLGLLVVGAIVSAIWVMNTPELMDAFNEGYENAYSGM